MAHAHFMLNGSMMSERPSSMRIIAEKEIPDLVGGRLKKRMGKGFTTPLWSGLDTDFSRKDSWDPFGESVPLSRYNYQGPELQGLGVRSHLRGTGMREDKAKMKINPIQKTKFIVR